MLQGRRATTASWTGRTTSPDPDPVQRHLAGPGTGGHHGAPPPQWYQDLPDWLTGLCPYDLNLNLPAFMVEILIPTMLMVGLPVLLVYILWRIGWVNTRRDVMLCHLQRLHRRLLGDDNRRCGVPRRRPGAGAPWDVPRIDG